MPLSQAPLHVLLLHFLLVTAGDSVLLLVTAGAYVLLCRSLRRPCTFCFCTYCHYNYLLGFRLQRWVGGLMCFFLNTCFLATAGMPFSGEEVLMAHAQCAPHARVGFVQS